MEFLFNTPTTVFFGKGYAAQVADHLSSAKAQKVLCIYDQGLKKLGIPDKIASIIRDAGFSVLEFGDVQSDPSYELVEQVAQLAKDNNIDSLVAIGGGSTMDTAKCVNILLTNPGPLIQYSKDVDLVENKGKFLILIPTTFGTGSEVTDGSVISVPEEKQKVCIWGKNCGGDIALIDPELSVGMPEGLTAATGMDALSHAVESYTSNMATPLTEALSLKAIELIVDALPKAVNNTNDFEARENMCLGSLMAGMAFNSSLLNQGHGLAHPMGAHWHIPHGIACAWALPFAIKDNGEALPEKTKTLASLMGVKDLEGKDVKAVAAMAANSMLDFIHMLKIPTLRQLNVPAQTFNDVALALKDEPDQHTYPHMPDTQDITDYFNQIYNEGAFTIAD
jgi:alcohol dehydrogenase